MNKWTFRLIGLIIVLLITAIMFRNWFFPTVPPVLQQEISLQVNGKEQTLKPSTAAEKPAPAEELPLTLTSLDENARPKTVTSDSTATEGQKTTIAVNQNQPAQSDNNALRPENDNDDNGDAAASRTAANTNSTSTPAPAPEPEPTPEPAQPTPATSQTAAATPQPAETIEVTSERTNKRRRGNWVQAGAFSSKENADNFVAKLKRRSWPVVTEDAVVNGKLMHRVLVGPLSRSDVDVYIDILGKMGFNARQVSR